MRASKSICLTLISLLFAVSVSAQYRSLMRKANKQYELQAFHQAIDTYQEALSRRPNEPEALGNLADCYRHVNDMMEAAKYYARAIAQNRVEARHILNYAHVLKALGRYDDAKRWYLEYAKDDPMIGNHYAETCDFAKAQQQLNTGLFVTNEEKINSPSSDFGPAFRQGQVVFSSSRIDIQRSSFQEFSGQQPNQLYIARLGPEGMLENPVFLNNINEFEKNVNRAPLAFSPDGRYVVYTKNNFVNGTRHIPSSGMQLYLYIAEINPNGLWVNEQPFPYNSDDYSTGFPSFSPTGDALYFASDRPDGFGGYDIYVSFRTGNTWARPENLGPVINSPGNELTPNFDGENLFFASDWHPGFGGLDLFRAEKMNNRWSQIFHIGSPVSSPRDDYGLVYDKLRNVGYFVSNREGGAGLEDIYSLSRPADNIILTVKNASDGSPVANAFLDFSNCGQGLVQADDRGVYRFQAVDGMDCEVTIRKEGYQDKVVRLSSNAQQGTRPVDVQLVRRGEEYYGKILNYNTRLPVNGVTVIATNQLTGNTIQVTTDPNGDYTLALSSGSTYKIRYSRPGFRDVNREVETQQTVDPGLLGTISILPADAPLPSGVTGSEDLIDPYAEPAESETPPARQPQAGYAVQVAAVSKPNLNLFSELKSVGTVYSKQENGVYKIRVGVFADQAAARQALTQAKGKGHQQAFIVREEGVELAPKNPNSTFASTSPGEQVTGYGRYKIQLGAYRSSSSFDDSKIRDLGYIEDKPKGNLTVKYLSGFNTLDEARQALPRVTAAGFVGAFILERTANGSLQRVQ